MTLAVERDVKQQINLNCSGARPVVLLQLFIYSNASLEISAAKNNDYLSINPNHDNFFFE